MTFTRITTLDLLSGISVRRCKELAKRIRNACYELCRLVYATRDATAIDRQSPAVKVNLAERSKKSYIDVARLSVATFSIPFFTIRFVTSPIAIRSADAHWCVQ